MCLLPRNNRMRSCGTTQIRLALVQARWLSRQTQGIRLVCRLLLEAHLWYPQVAMSSPNASPLWHPRTLTLNTRLPWKVGYTDARPGPSSRFMVRGAMLERQPVLGAVPVPIFQMSRVRARVLMKTGDEGRAYRRVRC